MIAYKYKLSMCLVVNHVVVICDCLQVHKCCNPIQVYVFRSIDVMSPGGCGCSFIVTSHVVGVYMELCISLKVRDSVVHYWSWSALKFSNFKIVVQFIDPCPVHQRTPWSFCFLLRGH